MYIYKKLIYNYTCNIYISSIVYNTFTILWGSWLSRTIQLILCVGQGCCSLFCEGLPAAY